MRFLWSLMRTLVRTGCYYCGSFSRRFLGVLSTAVVEASEFADSTLCPCVLGRPCKPSLRKVPFIGA